MVYRNTTITFLQNANIQAASHCCLNNFNPKYAATKYGYLALFTKVFLGLWLLGYGYNHIWKAHIPDYGYLALFTNCLSFRSNFDQGFKNLSLNYAKYIEVLHKQVWYESGQCLEKNLFVG